MTWQKLSWTQLIADLRQALDTNKDRLDVLNRLHGINAASYLYAKGDFRYLRLRQVGEQKVLEQEVIDDGCFRPS